MTGAAVCLGLLALATAVVAAQAALTALGRLPRRRQLPQPAPLPPSFVVLIPAHDEEAALPAALRSVACRTGQVSLPRAIGGQGVGTGGGGQPQPTDCPWSGC